MFAASFSSNETLKGNISLPVLDFCVRPFLLAARPVLLTTTAQLLLLTLIRVRSWTSAVAAAAPPRPGVCSTTVA